QPPSRPAGPALRDADPRPVADQRGPRRTAIGRSHDRVHASSGRSRVQDRAAAGLVAGDGLPVRAAQLTAPEQRSPGRPAVLGLEEAMAAGGGLPTVAPD